MAILTVHTQIEGISTIPWDTLPCNISNPQRHYYNICQKQKRGKCTNEESKLGNNSWKVFLKDEGDSTIPKKNFQMQSGILRQNVALQEISIQHFFKPFSRNSLRPFWDFGKCDASQPPCAVEPRAYTVATPSKPRDLQCAAWPRHHKFHKGAWRNEAVLLHRSFFRIIVGRLWSGGKIRTQWKCNQAYVRGIIWTQFSVCRAFHRSHWLLRCKPHSQRHQWKIMRL